METLKIILSSSVLAAIAVIYLLLRKISDKEIEKLLDQFIGDNKEKNTTPDQTNAKSKTNNRGSDKRKSLHFSNIKYINIHSPYSQANNNSTTK